MKGRESQPTPIDSSPAGRGDHPAEAGAAESDRGGSTATLPEGWTVERARSLLIALNASGVSRDAVCRLSRRLDLFAGSGRDQRRTADALGVSGATWTTARGVARLAPEIAASECREAATRHARVVTVLDAEYPTALLDLELPPPVLYVRGQLPKSPGVAVVGSRNADPYGLEAARLFATELAAAGATVISGFARGVDATAHRAALDQERGTTVAVLGCGLGVAYPRAHYRMLDEIADRGAAVSEFPCDWRPRAANFPVRNRLIAALGAATLVIQATHRSGALITARFALELGRDIFAVPGRIFDPRSAGANALLRDGALMALEPANLLEGLSLEVQNRLQELQAQPPGSPVQRQALQRLEAGAATVEELARALERSVEEVLVALLELELGGRITRYGARFGLLRG